MVHELITLKNQFDEVAKAKGKSKIPLIKKFATDPVSGKLFKQTYDFVFNPFITTGIAKKKINKDLGANAVDERYTQHLATIEDMFNYISKNNSGSDGDVREVQSWILSQPNETHEFLKCVFINDLQIGASEKAINEALGYDFIPVWDVMLAKRWEKEEHKVKGDFTISLKMDDYRTTIIFNEVTGEWEFKARSGMLFEDVVEIQELIVNLPKDYVYDGGLISTDHTLKAKDRFRDTGKRLKVKGPKRGLMFYIYDMIPKVEFEKGKSKLGYKARQDLITGLINDYRLSHSGLFLPVPKLYEGNDKEQIMPLLEKVLAEDYEGLMVNTNDGKYETKRSDQLLKVKEFYTVDLRVIDTYEYKHPGKLGGFICEYKDGNTIRVGGGFKLHEREQWWPKREEFIGKIIEVRYFQESKNQNGGTSIRHGHFVGLRWDKTEPSYD